MQSLASLMSVNTTGDIAPLEDFEEEDGNNSLSVKLLKLPINTNKN